MVLKAPPIQSIVLLSVLWLILYSSSAYAIEPPPVGYGPDPNEPGYTNMTVYVPVGTYATKSHLLCLPSNYNTVIFFFIGNYFSHATAVSSDAGDSLWMSFANIIFALILPGSGLIRGMQKIKRMAGLGATPLQRAARAGATVIVVRNERWRPVAGQKIYGGKFTAARGIGVSSSEEEKGKGKESDSIHINFSHDASMSSNTRDWRDKKVRRGSTSLPGPQPGNLYSEDSRVTTTNILGWQYSYVEDQMARYQRRVHGSFRLPPGYSFRILKGNVKVFTADPDDGSQPTNPDVSASYNLAKSLIAVAQLSLAFTTLLKSRGDQVDRYGYAAYGLTVVPYAMASLVQLVGNCITPDYPALFMVRNEVMKEAESVPGSGVYFDGVVGFIRDDTNAGDVHDVVDKEGSMVLCKASGEEYAAAKEKEEGMHTLDVHACGDYRYVVQERWMDWWGWNWIFIFLTLFLLCVPLIVIGSLSGFKPGFSTPAQRVWIMGWLVLGAFFAFVGSWKGVVVMTQDRWWVSLLCFAVFCVFPIGGFVEVAGEILDYGDCLALMSG